MNPRFSCFRSCPEVYVMFRNKVRCVGILNIRSHPFGPWMKIFLLKCVGLIIICWHIHYMSIYNMLKMCCALMLLFFFPVGSIFFRSSPTPNSTLDPQLPTGSVLLLIIKYWLPTSYLISVIKFSISIEFVWRYYKRITKRIMKN